MQSLVEPITVVGDGDPWRGDLHQRLPARTIGVADADAPFSPHRRSPTRDAVGPKNAPIALAFSHSGRFTFSSMCDDAHSPQSTARHPPPLVSA
jgi:hypothetical protein